ncbi:DNA primase [Synoicihabitans lomoniglobus]|uniref:DNA primase n=1 Tax=Synoicihabitans lomoniglobus TaxID=2909285 RepID=A0AAE9ZVC3_9BACT|nr:DNA primase [Opitutaceae bacterium LMO-M01]WED63505.1 DNA primase [Opitutaceae bacterium LMO-M01]
MPLVKPTCVRDLRARVNIVDVISRSVTLKKAGSRFKGLCPFHQEKSPSFHVNPDMGVYKCFGCGKSGDLITFVRETEGLNFIESVEALGQRFNVPIEYENGAGPSREERSLRQEIFELHEITAQHYHECFRAANDVGNWMRDYWENHRRFTPELAEEFKIGAVGADGSGLGGVLMKHGFSEAALRQCGLFFIYEDAALTLHSLRPRFRGRLMIPIRDHQGRVVAFTARQTELTPDNDPAKDAKYVNSPETPIFVKGNLLFNLDRARTAAGEGHPFVMVEGQLDALRCWSVGLKTAIAPQGTAITETQLALLRRYHNQVECFFDGDGAGQKAALRFLPMALKAGMEVRFLTSKGDAKLDPDLLFLERGLAGYDDVKAASQTAMEFAGHALLPDGRKSSAERKAAAVQPLFEIIIAAESEVARSEFINEASRRLGLSALALTRDFEQFRQRGSRYAPVHREEPAPPPAPTGPQTISPEHHLLLLCLHFEQLGKPISHILPHDWVDAAEPAGALLNRFLAEFEHDAWPGAAHLSETDLLETEAEKTLVASLLFDAPSIEDPFKAAEEGLQKLRDRTLRLRLRQIELALSNPASDIQPDAFSLLKSRSELQRQLRQPLRLAEAV